MTRSKSGRKLRIKRKSFYPENSSLRKIAGISDYKKLTYLINAFFRTSDLSKDVLCETALRYCTETDKKNLILMHEELPQISNDRLMVSVKEWKQGMLPADDVIEHLLRVATFRKSISKYLLDVLCSLEQKAAKKTFTCVMSSRLDEIATMFDLSSIDREIVLFLFLSGTDTMVDKLHDEVCSLTYNRNTYSGTVKNRKPVMVLTGLSRTEIDTALMDDGRLLHTGIITQDHELAPEVLGFLYGGNTSPLSHRYFSAFDGETIPLESHTMDKQHMEMIRMLLENKQPRKSTNILLYGEPGTGKTEFARALGKELSYPVYEIHTIGKDNDREKTDQILFRYRALMVCEHMVDCKKSIIVVDEADSLLNSEATFYSFRKTAEKGQINRLLDTSTGFTIWITNRHDGIEESTKRRFDYSIGFEKLTFEQRKAVWRVGIKKHNLTSRIPEERVDELAQKYEVSAGGIDVALRNVKRIHRAVGESNKMIRSIDTILKAHQKIINPEMMLNDERQPRSKEYSLEGLNIKGVSNYLAGMFESFNGAWKKANDSSEPLNLNVLLYGPPGTGKTEYAKWVARNLNRRLISKRASDLLNCYVGETEKLIRAAFREAANDKAILFIDEADSFLSSREGATHSWEHTRVNEFLTNMESHRGILLCATNFKKVLDNAAMRRFFLKLEFDYLTADGNVIFYERFFKTRCLKTPTPEEIETIRKIPCLAPGDFNVVFQKLRFMPPEAIGHAALIGYLREEVACKQGNLGKKMGFA